MQSLINYMQQLLGGVCGVHTGITSLFCSVPACSFRIHVEVVTDVLVILSQLARL